MRDFATKLPRVAEAALAFKSATGDITAPKQAVVDAACEDIPKLGWEAPYGLLSLIRQMKAAEVEAGPPTAQFDAQGNGPFCAHWAIHFCCPKCGLAIELRDRLVSTMVRMASAQ